MRKEHGAERETNNLFSHEFSPAFLLLYDCLLLTAYRHLITLSARNSTDCGIVRPICFGCRKIHHETEAGRLFVREIRGFGNLLKLIIVVALFVACATMAMFFRILLIWDCST
jgi:hypothetical protein